MEVTFINEVDRGRNPDLDFLSEYLIEANITTRVAKQLISICEAEYLREKKTTESWLSKQKNALKEKFQKAVAAARKRFTGTALQKELSRLRASYKKSKDSLIKYAESQKGKQLGKLGRSKAAVTAAWRAAKRNPKIPAIAAATTAAAGLAGYAAYKRHQNKNK